MSCLYRFGAPTTVDALPVELLSDIFHIAAQVESKRRGLDFDFDTICAPLQFASVSRHWRNVALSTPSIWSSILVTLQGIEDSWTFDTRHIVRYLELSKNYPLDILVDARDIDWDFSEPE
jgi:hypothetical protein